MGMMNEDVEESPACSDKCLMSTFVSFVNSVLLVDETSIPVH